MSSVPEKLNAAVTKTEQTPLKPLFCELVSPGVLSSSRGYEGDDIQMHQGHANSEYQCTHRDPEHRQH